MPIDSTIPSRKSDHIQINMNENVQSGLSTGLEAYAFIHQALPEFDLAQVDMRQTLFNKQLQAPILISSMTGGTEEAKKINIRLAEAAQNSGIALGLGSQRVAIELPELSPTFAVRKYAPDILLFANLGAVQLNYGYGIEHCRRAIDMIEADALILHLNALQEALQPNGEGNFSGLLKRIEQVCKQLKAPVIVKEVGWGISEKAARLLAEAGVAAIDVAGAGGTSWSQVEMYRIQDESLAQVAAAFRDWGIPTAESIQQVVKAAPGVLVFASGGLLNGVDIAKCLALGATLGGIARPFLRLGYESSDNVYKRIEEIKRQLQICMFASGAINLDALHQTPLIAKTSLLNT
jgi:isopentenyl-diphosphate delta-isomerase